MPRRTWLFGLAPLLVLLSGGCQESRWDAHDAHRWCRPALRDAPGAPDLDCDALHMCANEVTFSDEDTARFDEAMSRLRCESP